MVELTLSSEWSEAPEFSTTEDEDKMLAYVVAGGTPENASIASGVGETWRQNDELAAFINRIHAHNIARVEANILDRFMNAKPIPAGLMFYMKCYAGWHDKWGEDGFAQNVTIKFNRVNGRVTEEEEAEEAAKKAKKKPAQNAKKPSKKSKRK